MSGKGRRSGPGVSPARNGSKWLVARRRYAIYARDGWACVYCGNPDRSRLTLDHYRGHSNQSNNLLTCCLSCNSSKQRLNNRAWFARLRSRLGLSVLETKKLQTRIYHLLKKALPAWNPKNKNTAPTTLPKVGGGALKTLTRGSSPSVGRRASPKPAPNSPETRCA
jgi:hypothetical protein